MSDDQQQFEPVRPENEPVFNIPNVVLAFLLVMVAIQVGVSEFASEPLTQKLFFYGAFIPQRYEFSPMAQGGAYYWSAITYSLLHGGYMHLGLNSFWLAAFGSVVARRIGWVRFCVFWVLSALASAMLYLAFQWGDPNPMVGASGVISALMGAAARFAFPQAGRFRRDEAHLNPRLSIVQSLCNRTIVIFLAIWFGINMLTAVGFSFGTGSAAIAWQAHLGGFIFGFLTFALFDPIRE